MDGKLFLIGIGICDEKDISLRALDVLKQCKKVFAEAYTNLMRKGTYERLSRIIGKEIIVLGREQVEGEKIILGEANDGSVALLVPGDPMAATTHSSLLASAREKGITTRIIHSSSIFTAAGGECGLQAYKFGKTTTIAYWKENFKPCSFIDVISENLKNGAHSLCLLDIGEDGPMRVSTAFGIIKKAQEKAGKEVLSGKTKLFALWHVGWEDQKIWAGEFGEWDNGLDSDGPAIIIFLGKAHFSEHEFWENFRKKSCWHK